LPQIAVFGLGVVVVLLVAFAPVRVSFAALVVTLVVLPATLTIPNGVTSYLTIHNAALAAGVLAVGREFRQGRLTRDQLAPIPLQVALGAFVLVVAIGGVALANPTSRLDDLQHGMVDVLAQLLVLTLAVLYVRAIDDNRYVIGVLAGTLLVFGGIGAAEHFSKQAFGEFLFRHSKVTTDARFPLVRRAGKLRVRSGAEFALEYAWMCVMLAPALLAAVLVGPRRRIWWLSASAAVIVATIYWSVSRSAIAAAPLAVVIIWVGARWNRRITMALAMLGVVIALTLNARPQLTTVLRVSTDQGSVDSRATRLPLVAEAVVQKPIHGLGLGGLHQLGIPSTDATYNQVYAELGVLGLAVFGIALIVALVSTGRGLFSTPQPDRLLASVGFAGVLMGVLGSAAFDLFGVRGTSQLFWLLAGIGAVAADQCRGPLPVVQGPSARRWAVPAGALVVGVVVAVTAPTHAASTTRFLVSTPVADAAGSTFVTDTALGETACGVAVRYAASRGAHVACRELITKNGVREVRVEAASKSKVVALEKAVVARMRAVVPTLRPFPLPGPISGKPTAAKTAPVWLGLLGLGAALLLPGLPVRQTVRRWSEEGWASPLA
jgi:hypothetical protein